jgi:hypothetical protein
VIAAALSTRDERRRHVAAALASALERAGTSVLSLAQRLGMPHQHLAMCTRAGGTHTLHVADLLGMPEQVKLAVCQAVMGDGWSIARRPEAVAGLGGVKLACEVQTQTSQLSCQLLAAISDGRVDAAEGAALERAGEASLRVSATVIELGRQAKRERVLGVAVGGE